MTDDSDEPNPAPGNKEQHERASAGATEPGSHFHFPTRVPTEKPKFTSHILFDQLEGAEPIARKDDNSAMNQNEESKEERHKPIAHRGEILDD